MVYTNVLLVDQSILDPEIFVNSVNLYTFPILYSHTTTRSDILALLQDNFATIERIGIAFEINGIF